MDNNSVGLFSDFYFLYSAGSVAAAGGNPYDPALVANAMHLNGWPESGATHGFPYNPLMLGFFIVLSYLEFTAASWVWFGINLSLCGLCLWLVSKRVLSKIELWIFGFTFFPIFKCLLYGQTSLLPTLGICLYLFNPRGFWRGVGVVLMILKFHILIPFLVLVFSRELLCLNRDVLKGIVVAIITLMAIPLIYSPASFQGYLSYISTFSELTVYWKQPVLSSFVDPSIRLLANFVVISLAIIGALWLSRSRYTRNTELFILTVSILLAPFGWSHDQSVLFPIYYYLFFDIFLIIIGRLIAVLFFFAVPLFLHLKDLEYCLIYIPLIFLMALILRLTPKDHVMG